MTFQEDKDEIARMLLRPVAPKTTERLWTEFQQMFERVQADPAASAELTEETAEIDAWLAAKHADFIEDLRGRLDLDAGLRDVFQRGGTPPAEA
jgi:hypothetical protein